MRLASVHSEPRSHPINKLQTNKLKMVNYQVYFRLVYSISLVLFFFNLNNFGNPFNCHQTKKCSNGNAHNLIGM